MLTYQQEVERLLKDMLKAAIAECNPAAERETTEIAAIARQEVLPVMDDETPDSLISLHAQAAVVRAWRKHGENLRAA